VARACELAADHELTGVYNVGTEEAYSFNEMVAMINDALGTDIDPVYIECPFDGYVHDTMADYSTFHEATGWEPEIGFEGASNSCVSRTPSALPRRCSLGGTAPERGDPPSEVR